MADTQTQIVDPQRPWIVDARDAPADMKWGQTLFNPLGETSKVHFGRAWTFMFMGRLLLFVVPVFGSFILGLAGMNTGSLWKPLPGLGLPIPALLLGFFVFTIATEFTSFVAHRRRLANARRPAWLSALVLLPLILAMLAFVAGASAGAAQYEVMNSGASGAAEQSSETPADEASETDASANTGSATEEASEEEARAEGNSDNSGQRQGNGRGRQGPPPSQMEMAVGGGMGMAIPIWMLVSFCIMLWTLFYVARLPNDGVGKIQTGSVEPVN